VIKPRQANGRRTVGKGDGRTVWVRGGMTVAVALGSNARMGFEPFVAAMMGQT
jgi:hypothetical protein